MTCITWPRKQKLFANVTVQLIELTSVPLVTAVLFTKLRVLGTRGTSQYSSRIPVSSHTVNWNSQHTFRCKFYINSSTNTLESKYLKVSIRKECNGGKSFSKLGYVLVDLACFISQNNFMYKRKYILEGYSVKGRQDNSLLLLSIQVKPTIPDSVSYSVPGEDKTKRFSIEKTMEIEKYPNGLNKGSFISTKPNEHISLKITAYRRSVNDNDTCPDEFSSGETSVSHSNIVRFDGSVSQASQAIAFTPDLSAVQANEFSLKSTVHDSYMPARNGRLSGDDHTSSKSDSLPKQTSGKQQLIQATRLDTNEVVNEVLLAFQKKHI